LDDHASSVRFPEYYNRGSLLLRVVRTGLVNAEKKKKGSSVKTDASAMSVADDLTKEFGQEVGTSMVMPKWTLDELLGSSPAHVSRARVLCQE